MTKKMQRVLIMAGGTGGHVFPGLAIAKRLRTDGVDVHWLGTPNGLEALLVPEAGIPLSCMTISGWRGKGVKALLLAPFRLMRAMWQSMRVLHAFKPDVVMGFGGFVSGPGGIASWLLRYPLVIHEQNAKAGMTNQWLARISKRVLTAFPNTFPTSAKVNVVGNPVRQEMTTIRPPDARSKGEGRPLNVLVLGGSLGAQAINQLLPEALTLLPENNRPYVYHQAGEKHCAATQAQYAACNVQADVVPFIKEMDKAYAWADIVICRAGALTISELCAVGVGAIFIPYPHAVDDHQTLNARFMVQHGAALLFQQKDITAEGLSAVLLQLMQHPEQCHNMAMAAYALRKVDATDAVLAICAEMA